MVLPAISLDSTVGRDGPEAVVALDNPDVGRVGEQRPNTCTGPSVGKNTG